MANLLHEMLHAGNVQARPVIGELFDWLTQTGLTGFFTPTSGSLAFEIAGFTEEIDLVAVVDLDQFDSGNEPNLEADPKQLLNWRGNAYLLRSSKVDPSAYTLGFKMIGAAIYAPVISSSLAAPGTVGTPFNYFITATNNPESYSATGLPAGLTLNAATGEISGTPTTAAVSTVTIGATNAGGTGTAPLVTTIGP